MPLNWRVGVGCVLVLVSACGTLAPSLTLRLHWTRADQLEARWAKGVALRIGLRPHRRTQELSPATPDDIGDVERAPCQSSELCRWQLEAERSAQP